MHDTAVLAADAVQAIQALLPVILFAPLAGFLLMGTVGRKLPESLAAILGCAGPVVAFVAACKAFAAMLDLPEHGRAVGLTLYTWIRAADLQVDMGLLLDPLSIVMVLVVTGVGSLIHIYSRGYMAGDSGFGRYFAYLNLFTFSMLLLVLGDSLPVLFVGWEGVGLCSYLLIGFWFADTKNCDAGRKAFIVNRVGDLAFLVAMFWAWSVTGSMKLADLNDWAWAPAAATGVTALLLVGATGKSAQIPLYVWLPDAMAGPTPVSALIHAATMVTAGVYMTCRLGDLYALAPDTLAAVAVVGAATAFFAGTIALAQRDIKKVLAYSTVSQLGYMFLAVGSGAYVAAIFHLATHAFFKALLFLGAGSVIHALHHEQDMSRMGGLRARLPLTHLVMLVGCLALAGVPPFAGFVSKDMILSAAHGAHKPLYFLGVATAVLTAFYTFRLYGLTFLGSARSDQARCAHESPWVMVLPLAVLALLSAGGGLLNLPGLLGGGERLARFLEPVWKGGGEPIGHHLSAAEEYLGMGVTTALCALAVLAAMALYLRSGDKAAALVEGRPVLVRVRQFLFRAWYVDDLYRAVFVRPAMVVAGWCLRFVDKALIDGVLVHGTARLVHGAGGLLRETQSGLVRAYAAALCVGGLALVAYFALH